MVDYNKRPSAPATPAPSGAPAGGVNMNKTTLTKSAPSISLTKGTGAGGQMRVNLNWSQGGQAAGGFFKRAIAAGSSVDLDIGALYELRNGNKGVVQALGKTFGSLTSEPYILLDGDDRSGQNTGGENLLINLDHLGDIKRVLVFAYIYEGAPNWAAADGVVTLHPQGAGPIEIRLDEAANNKRFCAIAMIQSDGTFLKINREVNYVSGSQADLDKAYNWGMNWTGARK